MINLAISGAAGRMGGRLVDLGSRDPDLNIVAAIESNDHPKLGSDAGLESGIGNIDVKLTDSYPSSVEVVIDFSHPAGAEAAINFCLAQRIALVMATTGLENETVEKIKQAATQIPIVWAPSMSLAVNLTMKLVETAGRALKDHSSGVDVEILERHHRFKADAPSGTALKFGEIVADSMGFTQHQHGREGMIGQRPPNEIGYHAIRTGDNPGQHTIVFGMLGETIELNVAASNRDCYATGALAAAKFVVAQSPGLYNMYDVLGLNQ
ncbi:MAG: 4-hydroxy-tetrahydrodipicolinate reductase [Mariniblastus sp.]|nr:4-hydroxy-tetrahydrodipicolinate reductase [Mariniblastus sp.]